MIVNPIRGKIRNAAWGWSTILAGLLALAIVLHAALPDQLPTGANELDVRFNDSAVLAGYELRQDGEMWRLMLFWTAASTMTGEYTVFVEAVGNDYETAQCVGLPQDSPYPTWRWFSNRLVRMRCSLYVPDGVLPDRLVARLYDPQAMSDLPVIQNGQAVPDRWAVVWEAE